MPRPFQTIRLTSAPANPHEYIYSIFKENYKTPFTLRVYHYDELIVDKLVDYSISQNKGRSYEDFYNLFTLDGGSDAPTILDKDITIKLFRSKKLKPNPKEQAFKDGTTHCIFTPLLRLWSSPAKSKSTQKENETILKRIKKLANEYGDNPVPQHNMEQVAKTACTTIKIYDPLDNPYLTYNPNGRKTLHLRNVFENHVELANPEKPEISISHDDAVEYLQKNQENLGSFILEGTFQDPVKIHTLDEIYIVENPMREYIQEIHRLIPDIKFNATEFPDVNRFILESRIINSATLRFKEEFDQHYDLEKAYTQFHKTSFYEGFLGVIHQFRSFPTPPSDEFLSKNIGIYQATILHSAPLSKMLGMRENHTYILPLPEWKFHQSIGTTFQIQQGVFGSRFDFQFPASAMQTVKTRTSENKPFRIFAGQLSSKVNENSYKTYSIRCKEDFAEHITSIYPDTFYNQCLQTAEIHIPYKTVFTKHHLFSFITSYTRIVMMEQMLKFSLSNLSAVTLDGLYFTGNPPDNLIPEFRKKPSTPSNYESVSWYQHINVPIHFPPLTPFQTSTFLSGAGGSGKTHTILSDKGFNTILYASPTHELGKDKKLNYNVDYTTIHRLVGEKCESYLQTYGTPPVIFVDELTQIEAEFIDRLIKMYPHSLIFIAGDVDETGRHFQCKYSNQIWKPTFPTIHFENDYRSKTIPLKTLKQDLREFMKTDPTRYDVVEYIQGKVTTIPLSQAIEEFTTDNIWIAGTHKYIKTLQSSYKERHNKDLKIYTTHSYQGKTIEDPTKLYISIHDMFEHTMLYTAISRVRNHNQLVFVS